MTVTIVASASHSAKSAIRASSCNTTVPENRGDLSLYIILQGRAVLIGSLEGGSLVLTLTVCIRALAVELLPWYSQYFVIRY